MLSPIVLSLCISSSLSAYAFGQSVIVKYRETPIDLKHLACTKTVSSFVNEVCYDRSRQYLIILLNTTRYHWCEVDPATVGALLAADSKGRYFNANIKGKFDCRTKQVPTY